MERSTARFAAIESCLHFVVGNASVIVRQLAVAAIVLSSLAVVGCGDSHGSASSHGSHGSHGSSGGHDSHAADDSHGSHGSSHGEEEKDSHGGHGALSDAALETSIAFQERPRQLMEVDLGEILVIFHDEAENESIVFESKIFGLVDDAHAHEFEEALHQRHEALREALRTTVQKTKVDELFDPKLAGLKITLAAVARKTLRSPHLYDILFSDLSIERD